MRSLRLLGAAALLGAFARPAWSAASLARAAGVVEIRRGAATGWELVVSTTARRVAPGDAVRSGEGASAVLGLDGGALLALGPATEIVFAGSTARPIVELKRGRLRVSFGAGRTPLLRVSVAAGLISARAPATVAYLELPPLGAAVIETAQGLVIVEDARGGQLVVHAGERVRVDLSGVGAPDEVPAAGELARERRRGAARREWALERAREGLLTSVARESRLSELREGRALVDSRGARVRVEQFVVRPAPASLRYVVLNARAQRFDAFSLLGVFDRSLPRELSGVYVELPGHADAVPNWVMREFETLRTNGRDVVYERAEGGHSVDLNANADPSDDVTALFDPRAAGYVDTTGRAVFKTLYDRYGLYVNGALKRGWRGNNVGSYDPLEAVPSAASGLDPLTGAAAVVPSRTQNVSFPDAGLNRRLVYESFGDGTYVRWDARSTEADGTVGPRGGDYLLGTLGRSFEQTLEASEFGGRRIELTLPAAIPAAAGLQP